MPPVALGRTGQKGRELDARAQARAQRDNVNEAIDALKDKAAWDALTAAQRQEALRKTVLAALRVARFVLTRDIRE